MKKNNKISKWIALMNAISEIENMQGINEPVKVKLKDLWVECSLALDEPEDAVMVKYGHLSAVDEGDDDDVEKILFAGRERDNGHFKQG